MERFRFNLNANSFTSKKIRILLIELSCLESSGNGYLEKVAGMLVRPLTIRSGNDYLRKLLAHREDIIRHADVEAVSSARKDEVSMGK